MTSMQKCYEAMVKVMQQAHAAYHEAGHTVAYLAAGARVAEVRIDQEGRGCTVAEQADHFPRSKAQMVSDLRQQLLTHVAGPVASCLRDQWDWFGRWPTAKERRHETEDWDFSTPTLLSRRYAAGEQCLITDDLFNAQEYSLALLKVKTGRGLFPPQGAADKVVPVKLPFSGEEVHKEILQAEGRAERLLKKHWPAVQAIADKLLASKSGRLTHGRLMKLVGHHFEPLAAAC